MDNRHQLLKKSYKQFTDLYVKPIAHDIDEEERFPIETCERMKSLKMYGIPYPIEYGGSGADTLAYVLAVEELSKACATTGVILSAHTSLGAYPIYAFGTEEHLGAFGLTEPNAGTDAAGQKTVAILKDNYYEISGSKIFITNAGYADIYIVFAMTDPSKGTKGITAFILEKDMPGFTIGKKEKKLGIRGSSTCELIFDKVKVPVENRLGQEGMGFRIAMATLDGGRIGIAAQALGIAQGALDEVINYTKNRKQFNQSISQFQNTQFKIADMATQIEAARCLVYKAAQAKDTQKNFSQEAAMAKLFASETAMSVTTQAVQLFGGYGYTREYPVERMMRDAKITEIYEGTSEVQRMVISASVLR